MLSTAYPGKSGVLEAYDRAGDVTSTEKMQKTVLGRHMSGILNPAPSSTLERHLCKPLWHPGMCLLSPEAHGKIVCVGTTLKPWTLQVSLNPLAGYGRQESAQEASARKATETLRHWGSSTTKVLKLLCYVVSIL